jgi:hypothetical protein
LVTVEVKRRNVPSLVENEEGVTPEMTMTTNWDPNDPNNQGQGSHYVPNNGTSAGQTQPLIINMPPAQQGTTNSPTLSAEFQAFLDSRIEQVRKEEKDKLYPTIEELKGQLGELTAEREERIKREEEAQQQAAEEARLRQESEQTALERLQNFQQEAEQRFTELTRERDLAEAQRQKEFEWSRLQDYRTRRIAEESANIAPQFVDYISGNSEEQVEMSIAQAINKTNEIMNEIAAVNQRQRQAVPLPTTGMPATSLEGLSGTDQQQMSFTPEQLRDMPIEEYSKYRSQLMGALSSRVREQGPYAQ